MTREATIMTGSGYTFLLASWRNDADSIRAVREQVLRDELGLEWRFGDETAEADAFHILACDAAGRGVGVARMQRDGRIDYIVVLRPWRRVTVGGAILAYLVHVAQAQNIPTVWSDVPAAAERFFTRNGFAGTDAGIAPGTTGRRLLRAVPPRGARRVALQ